jgi:hypothetical protein
VLQKKASTEIIKKPATLGLINARALPVYHISNKTTDMNMFPITIIYNNHKCYYIPFSQLFACPLAFDHLT